MNGVDMFGCPMSKVAQFVLAVSQGKSRIHNQTLDHRLLAKFYICFFSLS
jgi:hypothetical protein